MEGRKEGRLLKKKRKEGINGGIDGRKACYKKKGGRKEGNAKRGDRRKVKRGKEGSKEQKW